MKNLEQTLAQSLLNQYEFCERMWQEKAIDRDYFTGQRVAVMSIATAMFGKDITGQIPLEFIKNLEKIANAEPQDNLVEVSRQEAHELFKFWIKNSAQAYKENEFSLAKEFDEKSDKWLEFATRRTKSK